MTNQILRKIDSWDATLDTPAANLAADEALLNACENGGPEVLRFWTPSDYFVVLGFSNTAVREANLENCRRDNIPILRRCSGGGAVLQGPGCLNYALVLRIDLHDELQTIPGSNTFIMRRQREALEHATAQPVTIEGCTDLCLRTLKFSGNSQRRLRHALLFHGTFLLDFHLGAIEKLLAAPSRQPAYRQNRPHTAFLTNLHAPADAIKSALCQTWNATEPLATPPDFQKLAAEKYATDAWNFSR